MKTNHKQTYNYASTFTPLLRHVTPRNLAVAMLDRKSTRLNSSHSQISYAVFCLKKKKECADPTPPGPADAGFGFPLVLPCIPLDSLLVPLALQPPRFTMLAVIPLVQPRVQYTD